MQQDPANPLGSSQPGQNQPDYNTPVAYDNQGRPLYARPPEQQQSGPQMVYLSRPLEAATPQISPEMQQRIDESHKLYPHLNLSDGEYVIIAIKRHPIGILQIWAGLLLVALLFVGLYALLMAHPDSSPFTSLIGSSEKAQAAGGIFLGGLTVLLGLGGLIATLVYNGNRFYLTNESVIQEVQTSLFSKYEQTVSLSNVEDASYRQDNPIQMMLNYGSIRLSTEGDETTYRFSYVSNPKKNIATLNNAVEAFKNGRPVH
jgi:hypothetical protein